LLRGCIGVCSHGLIPLIVSVMGKGLRVTGYGLRVTGYGLWVMG
jgi:hypothetical protein